VLTVRVRLVDAPNRKRLFKAFYVLVFSTFLLYVENTRPEPSPSKTDLLLSCCHCWRHWNKRRFAIVTQAMAMTMTDTASIKPANWGKLKDQVVSWIDGENHCVTAQRISQSLDISRKLGSQLLEEILIENHKHQITICQKSQDENTTGE
jgi:hypothetical protein